jgi:hypothetical protein
MLLGFVSTLFLAVSVPMLRTATITLTPEEVVVSFL